MRVLVFLLVAALATLAARLLDSGDTLEALATTAPGAVETVAPEAAPGGVSDEAEASDGARAKAGSPVYTIIDMMPYAVRGRTADDLLGAMVQGGPRAHGTTYFGLTVTQVEFRYMRRPGTAGCALDDVRIDLGVVIHLPEWVDQTRDAPFEVRREWPRFTRALRHHEDGHRAIAERGAVRTFEALSALRTPDCSTMDAAARALAQQVAAETDREQERYDARTGHGRTQGAVWPPR